MEFYVTGKCQVQVGFQVFLLSSGRPMDDGDGT